MQTAVVLTGMVLKSIPVGEYDRRITILTKERGKIGAFARGARKQGNRLMAATNPFSFGVFKLYEGKSSYNITEVNITNYFEGLRDNYEAAFYGTYFLEIADYYSRENNDDREMLKLLYQSLKALLVNSLDKNLVRYIFEIKAVVVNGEFPGIREEDALLGDTRYAIDYVVTSSIEKLYTFTLSEPVFREFQAIATHCRERYMGKQFKSLEILDNL